MGLAFTAGNDVFITADTAEGTHPWGPDRRPKQAHARRYLSPGVDAEVW